ncbi:MAG: metallophosphoesterase [Phycisphaeraceae bacterium]|nr:metallophosphoesterase [Phycisphaeraceae bacterium]
MTQSSQGNPQTAPDLHDPAVVCHLFDDAAAANLNSPLRKGSADHLPPKGRLLMTGDLHDHGLNYQRLLQLAQLDASPDHHLILHEVIHGPHRVNGRDNSVRMLARIAALKLQYPRQIHLMLGNHELSQIRGEGITKDSVNVVDCFNEGLDFLYDDQAGQVRAAMDRFIRSLLLAVRCPNRILCSHSLPSPRMLKTFDPAILDRVPTNADYNVGGSAYQMVWGRSHTRDLADSLAKAWDIDLFLMGHQPADMGYELQGDSMIVLASDHTHGVALPLDLTTRYTLDDLVGQLIPLAGVVL